jgi:hypothetical protein
LELPARSATAAVAISAAISAASTTAARTASASTTSVAALSARTSLIHGNRASAEIAAIQRRNRRAGLRAIGHLDKAEATQASAKLIANQIHFTNRSILSKSLS